MSPASRAPTRRRRILVCTPFTPRLDARHGGRATAQLLRRLAERNEIAILTLRSPGEDPVDPAIAALSALVVEVPVRGRRGPVRQRLIWTRGLLRGLPPWANDSYSPTYRNRLEQLLEEWRPDIVEFHLQTMAQYVDAATRRHVPAMLVDYDPASGWAQDLVSITRGPQRLARRIEVAAWRRYERRTRPQFGAIVVFAPRDIPAVARSSGGAAIVQVPLEVDVPAQPLSPEGSDPPTVVFVGGFSHPPNVDAASWLARNIFPRVLERVPEARLDLVGHGPGKDVLKLAEGPIAVRGSVPDVTPFLDRAAVVTAPIRIGGSMRMKVLEALAAGKAVVATPRAADGVEAVAGDHLIVAEEETELVDAIAALLQDPWRRRRLAERAREWAEHNLGWSRGVEAFEGIYDQLARAT
jgi:glycosyltransferase involved in cell wall biosynthesis